MRDQSVQTKKTKQKTIHVSLGDQKCHHRHRWKSNDWQREFSVGRIDDQLQQRESNRNVMNGCHLAVGRSRIDRWYITTLERPNRTDRPAFNRHDSSLGLFLNYITTTSPIFIFFFSGKAIQWKEKWIYWTRELLRRKWNIFFFYWAVVIHQRKEFRFFFSFKLTAIIGSRLKKLTHGANESQTKRYQNISCMNSTLSLHLANPNARRAEIVFSVANEFTDWSCDFSGKIMTLPEKGKRPKKK